jgi:hypothetical protein
LARRTAGANRLIGRDMSPYLSREARALAGREGLLDRIDFGGRGAAVGGWGGRCRPVLDMPFWVNLPLDPALKAKVDAPGIIGGGMSPRGVADASLYRRFHALGLTELRCFPQLVSVVPRQPRLERYQQQILAPHHPAGEHPMLQFRRVLHLVALRDLASPRC